MVVDLGAAPGGWIQASRKMVGEEGCVLGVDLKPLEDFGFANVSSIACDIQTLTSSDILGKLPKKANVVLSDLSPNVSGVWELDHSRQIYLSEVALKIAVDVLDSGGNFLVKTFQGSSLKEFIDTVRTYFRTIRVVKPKASRKTSAEVYVVALDFHDRHSSL